MAMTFEQLYDLIKPRVQLKAARVKSLYDYALAAPDTGEFWECGVYLGGSARLLAEILRPYPQPLRLFDTYEGFPSVSDKDGGYPKLGMFKDTSVESVRDFVAAEFATLHAGIIPNTFAGLESSRIAFAHIDVDLYEPTKAALEFILPRMVENGIIVIDDYSDPHWPGVATAVDEMNTRAVVHIFGDHDRHAAIL